MPRPNAQGHMSVEQKLSLADIAMALRDEQIEAKVVHYRSDVETSEELDAITAQVIRELQALQRAAVRHKSTQTVTPAAREVRERELTETLRAMLDKVFRKDRVAVLFERQMSTISKRFARLFFQSELHERIRGGVGEAKAMRHSDQALFHALSRAESAVMRELQSFEYPNPEVLEQAKTSFQRTLRELRDGHLARSTPELNELLNMLTSVLRDFLMVEMPAQLDEVVGRVVRESLVAETLSGAGYKISSSQFGRFRQSFERVFFKTFVPYACEEMLARTRGRQQKLRAETQSFLAEPRIYAVVCDAVCDATYEHLYNDGFLDLPADWRVAMLDPRSSAESSRFDDITLTGIHADISGLQLPPDTER